MKTILVDAIHCFVSAEGKVFEEMHELLETYRNKKILVTGADDKQFQRWNLDKMPYEVFTLKHNPEKTDPEYFQALLEYFGLESADVIYFEHNSEAVESARAVGINAYHYNDKVKDLVALKNYLDNNLK